MPYRNKIILITVTALILVLGFLYYFFLRKMPNIEQMTVDRKVGILSTITNTSVETISDTEKQKILNKADTGTSTKMVDLLSDEERLQILDKAN